MSKNGRPGDDVPARKLFRKQAGSIFRYLNAGILAGALERSDDGPLQVQFRYKGKLSLECRYQLRAGATAQQRAAFEVAIELAHLSESSSVSAMRGFMAGLKAGRLVEQIGNRGLSKLVDQMADARVKGGKATAKLSDSQKRLAIEIIHEKKQGLGDRWRSAACSRAAAELKSTHGIEVSKDTLLRLLRTQNK